MNKDLTQVDGKFYKKSKIVMLPTQDKEASIIAHNRNKRPQYFTNQYWINKDMSKQYLYFTTDEEIKEGDWCYITSINIVRANIYGALGSVIGSKEYLKNNCKKIIATTDKSLVISASHINGNVIHLPRPSNEFLKKYCELCGIDEVLVEYERFVNYELMSGGVDDPFGADLYDLKLKMAADNTITIKPFKIKDS